MASTFAWAQQSPPLVVNSTADTNDGQCQPLLPFGSTDCTLREAINASNTNGVVDTISFDIPQTDCHATTKVCTISPASALPDISGPTTIDGYTQGDATQNTLALGTDAVLRVELDGSNADPNVSDTNFVNGLRIQGANSAVKGLVINRFTGAGIRIASGGNTTIEGNFIGTDPDGDTALGNGSAGIFAFSGNPNAGNNNLIGGNSPVARNLISGVDSTGVSLFTSGNKVQGNLIGTKANAIGNLGNTGKGVVLDGSNNTVGGTGTAANTIAFNGQDGITIFNISSNGDSSDNTGNSILNNSIFENGGLGVDLVGQGEDALTDVHTPNDKKDGDRGPNNLQNFPILASATTSPQDGLTIKGKLNSKPRKRFTIQFFRTTGDEGKIFLGELKGVKTNRKGNATFTFKDPNVTLVLGNNDVTATATNVLTKDTSEFSAPLELVNAGGD